MNEDDLKKMEEAVSKAMMEFDPKWDCKDFVTWLEKWKWSAGYKRLCKEAAKAFGIDTTRRN